MILETKNEFSVEYCKFLCSKNEKCEALQYLRGRLDAKCVLLSFWKRNKCQVADGFDVYGKDDGLGMLFFIFGPTA